MNRAQIEFGFLTPSKLRRLPAQRHSPTSKAAAVRMEPVAGTKRAVVLAFLRRCPAGATDEQMQTGLPMGPNTQRPRRVELVRAKLVKDSGVTRTTSGGDQAVVWVAV